MIMDYLSQVYYLSTKFFNDYPASSYPELMSKPGRPYTCLIIDSHDGYYICVPFRSNIPHNNAFFFKGTVRSQNNKSGLDYSKLVIIDNSDYIDSTVAATVDQDEYNEMISNLPRIVNEVVSYLDAYINHVNGSFPLHPMQFARKYRYSTLVYFHEKLKISGK